QRVIVYPNYVNAGRTVAEGRRVPRVPGAEDPTAPEIYDCIVNGLKLPAELENKAYPREALLRGRVRVALRGPDGKPLNPAVTSRSKLLREIAALLPRHPARVNRPKQPAGGAAAAAAAAAAAVGSSASGSKQQVSAKKGGGKKKR
ncbi:Signal recognition particle 19 kDa protein, partial [Auxenochlorella protothecoides]